MPANLPPQYYELEREFAREKDPRERLRLAEELLAIMPKHKGTDKLQAVSPQSLTLLRVSAGLGHNIGSSLTDDIALNVDVYSFLFDRLGVTYTPRP